MSQPRTLAEATLVRPDIDFGTDELPDLPEVLESLRPLGPVLPVRSRDRRIWLFLGYENNERAFLDQVNFDFTLGKIINEQEFMGRTLQMMPIPEHRVHRGLVAPMFTAHAMNENLALIESVANEILDRIEGKAEVDIVDRFAKRYPFSIITRLLDIPVTDEDQMIEHAINLLQFFFGPEKAQAAREARASFDQIMMRLIVEHRKNPGNDLLSSMIKATFGSKVLDNDEILTYCRLLFPAGTDTTFKALGSTFWHVLADPELCGMAKGSDQDRARIGDEVLRMYPPIALQGRMASGDIVIGDADIRHGDSCAFAIVDANRDPAKFPDPHRFDPHHNNRDILTFGRGQHFCLGNHLARREIEVALKVVFSRFPDICLSPDHPRGDIVAPVFRGPKALWVRPYGLG